MPKEKPTTVDVVKVENKGQKIVLPEGMSLDRAIVALQREKTYNEEQTGIHAPIEGLVTDCAHAFYLACKEQFGYVHGVGIAGWFGMTPPTMLAVRTGPNTTVQVPWGRMELPGVSGYVQTGMDRTDGQRTTFYIGGQVKRKHERIVMELVDRTQRLVREQSIYKSRAFRIRLRDDDGMHIEMPEPHFLELRPELRHQLIFNDDVSANVETSIFTMIEHRERVKQEGVSLKRGVLLAGPWGTGKSMTSLVAAAIAAANGWTFILAERADELAEVLRLARMYQPSVVFCEDIDRVMSGERNISMDEILNIVDGVESKTAELMVILTTNDVMGINQAMLRPGRLDAVIDVKPPDAKSAERLVRLYGAGRVDPNEDLTEIGQMLAGNIPAVIMEVVQRSKLTAISRDPEDPGLRVTSADLRIATLSMQNQLALLAPREADKRSDVLKAADLTAKATVLAAQIQSGHHVNGEVEGVDSDGSRGLVGSR